MRSFKFLLFRFSFCLQVSWLHLNPLDITRRGVHTSNRFSFSSSDVIVVTSSRELIGDVTHVSEHDDPIVSVELDACAVCGISASICDIRSARLCGIRGVLKAHLCSSLNCITHPFNEFSSKRPKLSMSKNQVGFSLKRSGWLISEKKTFLKPVKTRNRIC